jgi:anti-sigma factor RsiW
MGDCTRLFNQIADLRIGNLDDEDQTELFAHLATCRDCRDLMQFHEDLASAGDEFGEVDSEALAGVRGRVLDEVRSTEVAVAAVAKPAAFWAVGRSRLLAAAAAVVLAIGGFAAGRMAAGVSPTGGDLLVATLEDGAQDHRRLRDVEDSPNIISNVAVRSVGDGRLAMSFDVARHIEIERPVNDPLVNEVLVHAILDQSSMGSRLKAVSMAAGADNGKVEEALVFSMLDDPELPVRMRALEILAGRPISDGVEQGLMKVLRHDESMQMRLLAIEVLASGDASGQRVLEDFLETDEAVEPAIAERLASFIQS